MRGDYQDVEIYVRRPDKTKDDGEKHVWKASYVEMARLTSHSVLEIITDYELEDGAWEVGIRERGDEQYSIRFDITPLAADNDSAYELQNQVAAVLNHWRQ